MDSDSGKEQALAELRSMQRRLTLPSLAEAIRLLESDQFPELTEEQIRAIGQYRAIEIDSEIFFEKAFTPGKEAAASLGFARMLGRGVVLEDLQRLLRTTVGPEPAAGLEGDADP